MTRSTAAAAAAATAARPHPPNCTYGIGPRLRGCGRRGNHLACACESEKKPKNLPQLKLDLHLSLRTYVRLCTDALKDKHMEALGSVCSFRPSAHYCSYATSNEHACRSRVVYTESMGVSQEKNGRASKASVSRIVLPALAPCICASFISRRGSTRIRRLSAFTLEV